MRYGKLLLGAAAAFAAIAIARPAVAQDRPSYELAAIEVSVMHNSLHQQAMELYEFPERWMEAGDLHKQAAESLRKNAAGQYFGFSRAALLYFHAGEFDDARRSMEKAAHVAEATGDVLTAANAYVDAAFIAIAEGFAGKKREFVAEARDLAGSELLTLDQREQVIRRIEGAPAGAASVRAALNQRFGEIATLAAAAG